jgi:hypothetical protein
MQKTSVVFPFLGMAAIFAFIAMACSTSSTSTPTSPTSAPQDNSKGLIATQTQYIPAETVLPDYFTESFLGDLSSWTYSVTNGDETNFTQSQTANGLHLELDDPNLYVYFYYDPYTYQDVQLDLTYTNLAHNSNNINLVCRSSADGRYEFTVQNDGLYQIWAYDKKGGSGYILLANGGSTAILSGQQQNQIRASCIGNTLTLFINGTQTRSVSDNRFFLMEGQSGFGVNISPSNPVTPVIVEFNSFTISQP